MIPQPGKMRRIRVSMNGKMQVIMMDRGTLAIRLESLRLISLRSISILESLAVPHNKNFI